MAKKDLSKKFKADEAKAGRGTESWPDDWWLYPYADKISENQRAAVLNETAEVIGLGGAPGAGKSQTLWWKFKRAAVKYPGLSMGIIREFAESSEKTIWEVIKEDIENSRDKYDTGAELRRGAGNAQMTVTFPNGSLIQFFSGIDDTRIQGATCQLIGIEEGANLDESVWIMVERQNRHTLFTSEQGYPVQIIWTSNQKACWLKDKIVDKWRDGEPLPKGWTYYNFSLADNPTADFERKVRNVGLIHPGGEEYARKLFTGSWDMSVCPVFNQLSDDMRNPNWRERHVMAMHEWRTFSEEFCLKTFGSKPVSANCVHAKETIFIGLDPGHNHPTAILWFVIREGVAYLFDEWVEPLGDRSWDVVAREIYARAAPSRNVVVYPDPMARKSQFNREEIKSNPWTMLTAAGLNLVPIGERDVRNGIQLVNIASAKMLLHVVKERCPKYLADRQMFQRGNPENREDEELPSPSIANHKYSHTQDAGRYAFIGMSSKLDLAANIREEWVKKVPVDTTPNTGHPMDRDPRLKKQRNPLGLYGKHRPSTASEIMWGQK